MSSVLVSEEFCGRVPLNQTNLIQPHGMLLVIDKNTFTILQVSENCSELFELAPGKIVSTPFENFISDESFQKLRQQVTSGIDGKLLHHFEINGKRITAIAHIKDGYLILEMEVSAPGKSFIELYQEIKFSMTAIEIADDNFTACKIVAEELKKISGFDKVMIYRFDEEWNGEVIAEVKEEGMESYLGLKFPSSDIPKQARELYKRSTYRLIPNVNYEPVRIYPVINPTTNSFTDLSDTNLRSVAAVHLEYLRNMQVVTSMSTRILKGEKLWGLIACHHRTAKYLSYEMASVFELLSNMISSKIASALEKDLFVLRNEKQQLYNVLIEEVYKQGDLFGAMIKNEDQVLKLLSADGVLIRLNNRTESFGLVPKHHDYEGLLDWLQYNGFSKTYHQPGLSRVYEQAKEFSEEASGILVLPVQPERGNYILAFRKEELQNVDWGGNPNEAVNMEADGIRYHPRASFKIWQQRLKEVSIPWKPEEIGVAEQFRSFVIEATLNKVYN